MSTAMIHTLVAIALFVGIGVPVIGVMIVLHTPLWLMIMVSIVLGFTVGRATWIIGEAIDTRRNR